MTACTVLDIRNQKDTGNALNRITILSNCQQQHELRQQRRLAGTGWKVPMVYSWYRVPLRRRLAHTVNPAGIRRRRQVVKLGDRTKLQ